MKITVHYPKTEEGMKELQNRIDDFHAKMIMKRVNDLDCSYEQKIKLLAEIRKKVS